MQKKHLNTLEFPKILERVASYAAFSASKELVLALQPSPYAEQVRDWQTETTEADHLLSVKVNIGVGGARDVRPHVERCQRRLILTSLEFLQVRQTLIAARELKRTITRLADAYPRLADIAQRIEECPGVVNTIGQTIDENGEIKNSASPALARIRRDMEIAHSRLMEKLNRMVASQTYSHYLQEALVTQRAGRYVLPVKAEFKGRIRGIVHEQSASGATLFVEPMATVELNNKWRQLQLDEENEIRKILVELSDLVADQRKFIAHTVEALAELDMIFAKAKYAHATDAIEPALTSLNSSNSFKLISARHPLLDHKTVVPVDVVLDEDTRMLVITGPNTGGKTVSLKTIGLLTAMAQAGLRIPAVEGSALPVFSNIFADIGDEQSIEQSLSTFSAHMTNVVQILNQCDEESLVIFDELGAGTDPVEGSAMARAILSSLLERKVTTFVATHYSELKAFAHTTPGVVNASMEFNVDTLTPTYRLRIGVPGASNAFTIAGRLGLSKEIIDAAQGLIADDAQQVEAMLAEIKAQADAARNIRKQAEEELAEAEAYTQQRKQKLAEIDDERRDILNSARADARKEIKAVREKIRALEEEARTTIEKQQELVEISEPVDSKLDTLEAEIIPEAKPEPVKSAPVEKSRKKNGGPIRIGDTVFVPQYATAAEVVSLQNGQVEVQLGRFRATVPLQGLELKERAQEQKPEPATKDLDTETESPGMELDLRGQVAEEALLNMDQYLDKAFLARLPWVRIIHGRGSGVLRQVVRQELHRHALVSSYRPGKEGEGGDGVTVAKMVVK